MPNFKEGQPTGVRRATSAARARWSRRPASSASSSPAAAIPTATTPRSSSRPRRPTEELEETCENCGKPMVLKRGRFGMFLACTGYPECKTTRKIIATKQGVTAAKPDQILDETCPNCGKNLVVKQGRFGEFTACTGYPECKYVKQKSTGVAVRRTAATSSSASRAAARCSTAARTIRSATSRSGTSRCSSRARSAAGRSSPRRSPSATAASSSAPTKRATTCAARSSKRPPA